MSTAIADVFCNVMAERDNPAVPESTPDMQYAEDIPLSIAIAAHSGTSFVPDKRGHEERAGYSAALAQTYEELAKHADTDEKRAILAAEFSRLREGYRKRYLAHLSSRSRVMSTMIAGPSNFPVRRMEKRNRVCDARLTELVEFLPRARAAILKTLHPELRPIMSGDADATERLTEKIALAEAVQVRMRAVNAVIRKHKKAGTDAQIAAMVGCGVSEDQARRLLQPDFAGRIGFADYELTNNNANIKRMKDRLAVVGRDQSRETVEKQGENGIRYEDSPADNRVRLFFTGKPDEAVRSDLKAHGFRWTPSLGCWQAYRNWRSLPKAKAVAGI